MTQKTKSNGDFSRPDWRGLDDLFRQLGENALELRAWLEIDLAEERAAIFEYEAGVPKLEAEARAYAYHAPALTPRPCKALDRSRARPNRSKVPRTSREEVAGRRS